MTPDADADERFVVTSQKITAAAPLVLPKKKAFLDRQSSTLPRLHTLCIAAAKRGGGKTTAITSMLRQYKKEGLCDRVFIISPTAGSNAEFYDGLVNSTKDLYHDPSNQSVLDVIDEIDLEAAEHEYWLDTCRLYREWTKFLRSKRSLESVTDETWLYDMEKRGVCDMTEPPPPKYPGGRKPVIHVMFDDIQGTALLRSPKSPLINLCIRHRHVGEGLGCSVWILTQSYLSTSSTPRCVRENAILLLLWSVRDDKLKQQIAHEAAGCTVSVDEFIAAYDFATKDTKDDGEGHGFLMVDYSAPRARQFRRGLDEIISVRTIKKKDSEDDGQGDPCDKRDPCDDSRDGQRCKGPGGPCEEA